LIGGAARGQGNIISGNSLIGVAINGEGATGNQVVGNTIGLGAHNSAMTTTLTAQQGSVSGSSLVGRGRRGSRNSGVASPATEFVQAVGVFLVDAVSNTIGGLSPSDGNVIAGNQAAAVYIFGHGGSARNNQTVGNWIGMASAGSGSIVGVARGQNSQYGVLLYNAPQNTPAMSGRGRNHFGKCTIANFREFSGPDPSKGQASNGQVQSAGISASWFRHSGARTEHTRRKTRK
jgi:hypothetical protein